MKDEEKNLIKNLFHRLKNTELNSSNRDESANNLIQNLVKKQPFSSYYMTQTILIQEAAIKKLSINVEDLKQKILKLNSENMQKNPSFLSNFFKNSTLSKDTPCDNSKAWNSHDKPLQANNNVNSTATVPRSSGFLGNALQTAMGVAGGMVLGNMLMNIFNHSKPEEEIFDTVNEFSSVEDMNNTELNNNNIDYDNDLINYDQNNDMSNVQEINNNEYNLDSVSDIDNIENIDDIDINDDNFI